MDINKVNLSFEFFPSRTPEGREKLKITRKQLLQFHPRFFSCTSGAGGSTREGTLEIVRDIIEDNEEVAPHLSCIGLSKTEIKEILDIYKNMGVHNVVALRGDIPSGLGFSAIYSDGFNYANQLVSFIREEYGDHFEIAVAAYPEFHPQARTAEEDVNNFVRKCNAGANIAITQYFYNSDAYEQFVNDVRAKGVNIPIIPGIMPITSFKRLDGFSQTCGAEIPRWLRLKLQGYADDTSSIRSLGLDVVTELCEKLLAMGAPGLHFYTLNNAGLVSTICQRLGFA